MNMFDVFQDGIFIDFSGSGIRWVLQCEQADSIEQFGHAIVENSWTRQGEGLKRVLKSAIL